MIYLLDGSETYHLAEKKHQLLSKDDVLPENILTIDGSGKDYSVSDAVIFCNTFSLFNDKRIVVVQDPSFLNPSVKRGSGKQTSSKKKKDTEDNASLLEGYIEHCNPDADLILYCFGYDADKRTREYKVLEKWFQKRVTHVHFGNLSPKELELKADETLRKNGIRMNRDARAEFMLRINGSATEFYRAMDKILLYDKKDLNLEDIEHLVPVNMEINMWKMADAFLAGNTAQTFRSVYEMTSIARNTYQSLVMLLAYRLRTVYNAVRCSECGMSTERIAAITGKRYPDLDTRSAHGRSSREILALLAQLADLDQGIKSGRMNDREGFEAFLLRNLNTYAGNTGTI